MGYMHIDNLYKNQDVLLFKECYVLEKIHGTSAHVRWKDGELGFFAGGVKHAEFIKLFDHDELVRMFEQLGHEKVTVFGEAYGGKCQKMSDTYGPDLKFIAFDVKIGDHWLTVPNMDSVARKLGFEVVDWHRVSCDVETLDRYRDRPSIQAQRNGCGEKVSEGIIVRPVLELSKSNGKRIIAKHKTPEFSERATHQRVDDPEKLKILKEAEDIAFEWVTDMRLTHVLDKIEATAVEHTGLVVKVMVEDVLREAEGEIVVTHEAKRAIGKRASKLFKAKIAEITR